MISAAASTALAASCASFSEGRDSTSSDAGTTPDAGVDSPGSAADAGDGAALDGLDATAPLTKCTGTVVEDFFDKQFSSVGWNITGAPVLTNDAGAPPPSLFAATSTLTSGGAEEHTIRKDFPLGGHTQVCIELDVLIEQIGGNFTQDAYAEVLEIGADARSLFAEMRSVGFAFTDNATPKPILGFAFGKWQHVVMSFVFDSVAVPSVEVPGVSVTTGEGPMGTDVPDHITVHLGVEAKGQSGNAGGLRVNVDNFRFASSP